MKALVVLFSADTEILETFLSDAEQSGEMDITLVMTSFNNQEHALEFSGHRVYHPVDILGPKASGEAYGSVCNWQKDIAGHKVSPTETIEDGFRYDKDCPSGYLGWVLRFSPIVQTRRMVIDTVAEALEKFKPEKVVLFGLGKSVPWHRDITEQCFKAFAPDVEVAGFETCVKADLKKKYLAHVGEIKRAQDEVQQAAEAKAAAALEARQLKRAKAKMAADAKRAKAAAIRAANREAAGLRSMSATDLAAERKRLRKDSEGRRIARRIEALERGEKLAKKKLKSRTQERQRLQAEAKANAEEIAALRVQARTQTINAAAMEARENAETKRLAKEQQRIEAVKLSEKRAEKKLIEKIKQRELLQSKARIQAQKAAEFRSVQLKAVRADAKAGALASAQAKAEEKREARKLRAEQSQRDQIAYRDQIRAENLALMNMSDSDADIDDGSINPFTDHTLFAEVNGGKRIGQAVGRFLIRKNIFDLFNAISERNTELNEELRSSQAAAPRSVSKLRALERMLDFYFPIPATYRTRKPGLDSKELQDPELYLRRAKFALARSASLIGEDQTRSEDQNYNSDDIALTRTFDAVHLARQKLLRRKRTGS